LTGGGWTKKNISSKTRILNKKYWLFLLASSILMLKILT